MLILQDVVLQLPDIHGRDLEEIKYTGKLKCHKVSQLTV